MRKVVVTVLGAVTVALISGCASIYSPDLKGVPTARFRMASTVLEHTWVSALKSACFDRIENAATMAFLPAPRLWKPSQESIGMPLNDFTTKTAFHERLVPAGSPINMAFFAHGISGAVATGVVTGGTVKSASYSDLYCTVGMQFTPEEGKDYEAFFEMTGQKCVATVTQLSMDKDGLVRRQPIPVNYLPRC